MPPYANNKGSSRTLWSTILVLALTASMAPRAEAATLVADGSTCTLADAITSANTDSATGGCPAGAGADIIDLQTDVTLSASLPQVSTEVTIAGNNHAVRGDTTFPIFLNFMGTLVISDTTISGGLEDFGGGLLNYMGILTLKNCTISGNKAVRGGGGVANVSSTGQPANLTVIDSVISGNATDGSGGGILNYSIDDTATINVINSTISGNTAATDGGGVSNYAKIATSTATLVIRSSAVSGNSTDGNGGGIYNHPNADGAVTNLTVIDSTLNNNSAGNSGGYGGGIENYENFLGSANMTVSNCTISGNSAIIDGGGIDIFTSNGTATITASTITGNTTAQRGGGIFSNQPDSTRLRVKRNLISGNEAATGGIEFYNSGGTPLLGGYNLLGHGGKNTADSFSGIALSPTDVSATSDSGNPFTLNAILSPLAYNGGSTQTHALPTKSPALDLAPKIECSTAPFNWDQRGSIRPYGVGCDAGSYEYKSNILLLIVPTLAGGNQR